MLTLHKLTHKQYEQTTIEAEMFRETIDQIINDKLSTLDTEQRLIYCEHLSGLGNRYDFEVEAYEHDREEAAHRDHGDGCSCASCINIFGVPF